MTDQLIDHFLNTTLLLIILTFCIGKHLWLMGDRVYIDKKREFTSVLIQSDLYAVHVFIRLEHLPSLNLKKGQITP